MQRVLFIFCFLSAIVVICGCYNALQVQCKPMLFPYPEYSYKAKSIELGRFYKTMNTTDSGKNLELFNLILSVPEGWICEKMHEKTYIFRADDGRNFIFSLNRYAPFEDGDEELNFIGCNNFKTNQHTNFNKSEKDLITDMYLFTDDQLNDDPTFWQYFILWSKSDILRNSTDLFHYNGANLEAFQRNINPEYDRGSLQAEIVIFPKKIAPGYIEIGSGFADNSFFATFVDMLDALNP
jgi:hypothetical protein